ncbi:unnamed protein product, partial [Symbiodinium sp. KB8]
AHFETLVSFTATGYISESHVQCRAPGVALADAVVPENPPEEEDMCAAYASLQERINTLRNIVNAMKEENLTFSNGSLETWYREQDFNDTDDMVPWSPDNMSYEASVQPPSPEQVRLEAQQSQLIFEAGIAYFECVAQLSAPRVVEERPLGGFLLASVWSPRLLDTQPTALGSDAFPVRLLPRLGISSVRPDSGPVTGGTLIAVVGNGFSQQGLSVTSVDFTFYPKQAEFLQWQYSVYEALCMFTAVGPPMGVFDTKAREHGDYMSLPASAKTAEWESMNVSISLDGKATVSDVLGIALGSSTVEMACIFFDHSAQGFIFEAFAVQQELMWRNLVQDACLAVPEVQWTHQQDIREPFCAHAGNGMEAFAEQLGCSHELERSLSHELRGMALGQRNSVQCPSSGDDDEVSTLPDIHLLPPVQILRVEPEIMAVVERNDTSSVPLLYLRVFGEEHFLKHAARSRTKRLYLNEQQGARRKAYLSLSVDGMLWSNSLPVFFMRQVRLEIAGPTLVPPFTPITLNITGTFESLQQYQILRRATQIWCDFGVPTEA